MGILFLCTGLLGVNHMAQAAVACSPGEGPYAAQSLTVNISLANSYAGNDLPVGSTIYRNSMKVSGYPGVSCDGPAKLSNYWTVSNEPAGAAKSMNGLSYGSGSGPVYPTNVPGVGVLVFSNNVIFSSSVQAPRDDLVLETAGSTGYGTGNNGTVDIVLIKTGPIASGALVNASSFPNISWRIPAQSGYAGLPVRPLVITFTGSVQFVTATCTTPDVNVKMGSYEIASNFTKVGSAGPWVDSSILMQNCPTFTGYYADHGTGQTSMGSSTAAGSTRNPNLFTLSIAPANSVSNGIIALDKSGDAATGVGLQLGYTPNDLNASATSPTTLWTAGAKWNVAAPTDGRKSIKIPLAARYYQNGSTVTPGQANAKVVVNIDYK
jgi:type 1 fimbria pilin